MENRITTGTLMALACSAMLAYAAPQNRPHTGAPPGATGAPASRPQNEKQITTITGCLQRGASPKSFVLIQTPGTSVPNGGVGTVGGRDQRGIQYDLVVSTKVDLSKLVGHLVEASGVAAITPPLDSRATGERGRASAESTLTRFNATSVRQTAPSC